MSDKVGTRSFGEEEQDAGLGFVRVNDISPSIQETIDLEIKRLMQVVLFIHKNFVFSFLFIMIGII
jgi:hypothetical protein